MPAKYVKMGMSFEYPENWTLDEDDALAGHGSVTVYSPCGAFWSVAVHPSSTAPDQLAQAAVDAMKEEYDDLEAEPASDVIAGWEAIGYNLNFYCLDLTNTATIRCLTTDQATYSIFCQAEDRDYDRLAKVFLAITASFLGNLKQLRYEP